MEVGSKLQPHFTAETGPSTLSHPQRNQPDPRLPLPLLRGGPGRRAPAVHKQAPNTPRPARHAAKGNSPRPTHAARSPAVSAPDSPAGVSVSTVPGAQARKSNILRLAMPAAAIAAAEATLSPTAISALLMVSSCVLNHMKEYSITRERSRTRDGSPSPACSAGDSNAFHPVIRSIAWWNTVGRHGRRIDNVYPVRHR